MGTIIKDELSSDIVVVSEKRAKRPHVHASHNRKKIKACPFCPGNENMTPPTIMQFGKPAWSVRCFQNKFPVFVGRQGLHEVVVDTPIHSASMANLPAGQVAKMLAACSERSDWMLSHGMKCVLVCKNEGLGAGASISHPHSQIFGMPFVPPRLELELAMIRKYRRKTGKGKCVLCDEVGKVGKKRKIIETENFVAIAPKASKWQYESRIMPKRHAGRLCEVDLPEMARVLKALVSAYNGLLGKVDYNYYIHSAPKWDKSLHIHLDFFPRLGVHAGLEEGAGVFINQLPPEKAAKLLREKIQDEVR